MFRSGISSSEAAKYNVSPEPCTAIVRVPDSSREREERKREVTTLADKVNSLHVKLIAAEYDLEQHQKDVARLQSEIRVTKRELKINSKALNRAVKR